VQIQSFEVLQLAKVSTKCSDAVVGKIDPHKIIQGVGENRRNEFDEILYFSELVIPQKQRCSDRSNCFLELFLFFLFLIGCLFVLTLQVIMVTTFYSSNNLQFLFCHLLNIFVAISGPLFGTHSGLDCG
jgi:hypothetical protein